MDYISISVNTIRHHSLVRTINMKFVILTCLAAVAVAAPQYDYENPQTPSPIYSSPTSSNFEISSGASQIIPIIKDERIQEDDGRYTVDVETGNGIKYTESGSPDGPEGSVIKAGQYAYTAPDGTLVEVKFVANENGFQPQSDALPVAPEFPHPIPQFVLDQIAKAAEEDALAAQASQTGTTGYTQEPPSQFYSQP